jgi:hypothetical protein
MVLLCAREALSYRRVAVLRPTRYRPKKFVLLCRLVAQGGSAGSPTKGCNEHINCAGFANSKDRAVYGMRIAEFRRKPARRGHSPHKNRRVLQKMELLGA